MGRVTSTWIRGVFATGAVLVVLLLAACGDDREAAAPATPTSTPTAAATPTADHTPAAERYLNTAGRLLSGLAELSHGVADVLEHADVESEEWRMEAREALDQLRAHHEEAERLTPPAGFEEPHEALLATTGRLARAGELLADGLESGDPALLEQAADEILRATVAIEEARLALRDAR